MIFDEWFHKEYEPADLQIKQYAERNESLHIPATVYLEDLKEAFEAGQKDKEAQIEKMKNCGNCIHCKYEENEESYEFCEKHQQVVNIAIVHCSEYERR